MKNDSTITLELLYAKNGSKKHLIFEKWEHFENSQNWPRGKGYRLCKIAFGLKIKNAKNMWKTILQSRELLYAKNGSKKHLIFEKWELLKIAKIGLEAKAIDFAK